MKIKEVIVVEGHHDTATLKQYFDVETIETNGSAIPKETLAYIKEVQAKRGIIIFTDPDYPGERVRSIINKAIPNCKNAFLDKKKALGKNKVGIEHATKKDLEEALLNHVTYDNTLYSDLNSSILLSLGLQGSADSKLKRDKICKELHIGKCNAKTFLIRLQLLGVTSEQLRKICEE